ncbi:ZIP family metal transporter [Candidatus Peribacteria bacterium]|nr:MAG: ZIP family metal transporter [Candidatus Peribacteria bacterium]
MFLTTVYTLISVIVVGLLALIGIVLFLFEEKVIRKVLLSFVSLSTGALLGDVFIHILPDLAENTETFSRSLLVVLGGILFSFILEKFIHWRHCHVLPSGEHHHHPMGIMNMAGETLHNFIDGLVIAAGYLASPAIGLSTTLAVILHEIPHEVGNMAVLLHAGFGRKKALFFNFLSGVACLLGAILVLVFAQSSAGLADMMLPFAAGNLLYIAGSDLIPELHKETRLPHGIVQFLCILAGMALMYAMVLFE